MSWEEERQIPPEAQRCLEKMLTRNEQRGQEGSGAKTLTAKLNCVSLSPEVPRREQTHPDYPLASIYMLTYMY